MYYVWRCRPLHSRPMVPDWKRAEHQHAVACRGKAGVIERVSRWAAQILIVAVKHSSHPGLLMIVKEQDQRYSATAQSHPQHGGHCPFHDPTTPRQVRLRRLARHNRSNNNHLFQTLRRATAVQNAQAIARNFPATPTTLRCNFGRSSPRSSSGLGCRTRGTPPGHPVTVHCWQAASGKRMWGTFCSVPSLQKRLQKALCR